MHKILIVYHRKFEYYISLDNPEKGYREAFNILQNEGFIANKSNLLLQIEKIENVLNTLNQISDSEQISLTTENKRLIEELNHISYDTQDACQKLIKRYRNKLSSLNDELNLLQRIEDDDPKAPRLYLYLTCKDLIREEDLIIPE